MLKIPTILCLITLSVLAGAHVLALEFFLYWKFWWFDIVMHFLGGIVIALGIFTLYDLRFPLPQRLKALVPVLMCTLIIALAWELFELLAGSVPLFDYYFDTGLDIVMALIGATVGYRLARTLEKL